MEHCRLTKSIWQSAVQFDQQHVSGSKRVSDAVVHRVASSGTYFEPALRLTRMPRHLVAREPAGSCLPLERPSPDEAIGALFHLHQAMLA